MSTPEMSYSEFVYSRTKKLPTDTLDLVHMAMGVSGEAGELLDAIKKTFVYNKPIDTQNVFEELGDIMFYVQGMANLFGWELGEIIQHNMDKLIVRYPIGYSDEAAQARADKA